jgi:hypothetical protein
MTYFGHPHTQWSGVDDSLPNALAVAQIGAEHAEAMHRARLDGIWPYMYAALTLSTNRGSRGCFSTGICAVRLLTHWILSG